MAQPIADRRLTTTATEERIFSQQKMAAGPDYGETEKELREVWKEMRATASDLKKLSEAEKRGESVNDAVLKAQQIYMKQNLRMIHLMAFQNKAEDDWKGKCDDTFYVGKLPKSAINFSFRFLAAMVLKKKAKEEERKRKGR
jgi:hypothetical protein